VVSFSSLLVVIGVVVRKSHLCFILFEHLASRSMLALVIDIDTFNHVASID
jgi:hypothetical protein